MGIAIEEEVEDKSSDWRAKVDWYFNRLLSMSPSEIAYRLVEHTKKLLDAGRSWSWSEFGNFDSGLNKLPSCAYPAVPGTSKCVERGQFEFFGQTWPDQGALWALNVWHLDPLTGRRWPGKETFAGFVSYRLGRDLGDVKLVWEVNRLQFLQGLAAAGRFEPIVAILEGWMQSNPPYQGVNWTSGIEAASRVLSLLIVLSHTNHTNAPQLFAISKIFIEAHIYWIARYPSLHSSSNNHRVAELAALFLASLTLPGMPSASRHRDHARRKLEAEILRQFYADGVGVEQSPTYAAYSAEWFVIAAIAAKAADQNFSTTYYDRLQSAANHLRWLMDDAGNVPRIGDDDQGRVVYFDQPPERYVSAIVDRIFALTDSAEVPPTGDKTFADGGYTVIRKATPKGTAVFTFDHGPLGFSSIAAHGHADALGVWLHWGEDAVLVDPGTYLYHAAGPARDYFRGTISHNTLVVEGTNQSTISGPFNWSQHAKVRVIQRNQNTVTAEHDGYVGRYGITHCRSLSWGDAHTDFSITDFLRGVSTDEPVNISIGFTLPPEARVNLTGKTARVCLSKGRVVTLTAENHHEGWQEIRVPYSGTFGEIENTSRIVIRSLYARTARRSCVSRVTVSLVVE